MIEQIERRAHQWIVGADTGVSSKTIWYVMMGVSDSRPRMCCDVPQDPSDFGRCYRLLTFIPEWRERLHEVASLFPEWGPMVERWGDMETLWNEERASGNAPKLYALMRGLVIEGRDNQ